MAPKISLGGQHVSLNSLQHANIHLSYSALKPNEEESTPAFT